MNIKELRQELQKYDESLNVLFTFRTPKVFLSSEQVEQIRDADGYIVVPSQYYGEDRKIEFKVLESCYPKLLMIEMDNSRYGNMVETDKSRISLTK